MVDDPPTKSALPAQTQLPNELIEVLEKLPRDKRDQITLIVSQAIGSFSGPFPPPWMLDDYERHHPGFLSELIERARQAQSKRESQDDMIIQAQVIYMRRGQIMMFILALAAFGVSVFAIYKDMQVAASVFGVTSLASLAAAFLRNPYSAKPVIKLPESEGNKPKKTRSGQNRK